MFEQLIKNSNLAKRYCSAPLASERIRFLQHFEAQGHSRSRLLAVNTMLMGLALNAQWHDGRISTGEIEVAADRWLTSRVRQHKTAQAARVPKRDFISLATQFLRFIGRFTEPVVIAPFAPEVESFLRFLEEERGLAAYTLELRRGSLQKFLNWLAEQPRSIGDVTARSITEYFTMRRSWGRATVKFHVYTLRSFFRFAASKGWCAPNLANTIDAPRLFAFENLPPILSWTDVQRLLAGITGPDPTDIRDRALIMLLAIYGLRMKEVLGLKLEDFDWTHERLNVHRSKQRKSQEFPLSKEVGDAVIRYLREVRPRTSCRHVFVTECMPHRPYGRTGLRKEIAFRLKSLGVRLEHYGPHVLRHACATHLLAQGFSMKQIGDHLGHRSTQATGIYAKVNFRSLRGVADLEVQDFAKDVALGATIGIRDISQAKLAALREIADLQMGGVE